MIRVFVIALTPMMRVGLSTILTTSRYAGGWRGSNACRVNHRAI